MIRWDARAGVEGAGTDASVEIDDKSRWWHDIEGEYSNLQGSVSFQLVFEERAKIEKSGSAQRSRGRVLSGLMGCCRCLSLGAV